MNKTSSLFSVAKKYIMCYFLQGSNGVVNLIMYIMIRANLSPYVYFVEILIDKNKASKKLTFQQICKKLSNVN